MIVIGITGPTGAGKTTALNVLRELGGVVIDCDAVYHGLLRDSVPLRAELEDRFGPMTGADGSFDRKKLGAVVFHDPAALADLNEIVYRYIVAAVKELVSAAAAAGNVPAAAIDGITLFESGLGALCDTTVAITAPAEIRVERIMAREGISREYAQARVNAQNPEEFFTSRCAHTLRNDCASAEAFARRARELFTTMVK